MNLYELIYLAVKNIPAQKLAIQRKRVHFWEIKLFEFPSTPPPPPLFLKDISNLVIINKANLPNYTLCDQKPICSTQKLNKIKNTHKAKVAIIAKFWILGTNFEEDLELYSYSYKKRCLKKDALFTLLICSFLLSFAFFSLLIYTHKY